jgi:hypothetical protein
LTLRNGLFNHYVIEEDSLMPLTNAQVQARWRKRNVITLTAPVQEIVGRLVAMEDRAKLALIVALLNAELKPNNDPRCKWVKDDGGRGQSGIAYGHKGDDTRDCVARSIAIATQKPYREVNDALTAATVRHVANAKEGWGMAARRSSRVVHLLDADNGVHYEVSGPYLESLGWRFTSTKELPRGKGIHLRASELPSGRLIVSLPRHYTAVIDGVIHDTINSGEGCPRILGYWSSPG